jgi:hypothetical protein
MGYYIQPRSLFIYSSMVFFVSIYEYLKIWEQIQSDLSLCEVTYSGFHHQLLNIFFPQTRGIAFFISYAKFPYEVESISIFSFLSFFLI